MPRFPVDHSDFKPLGGTGEKLSAIGLGTWAIRDYDKAYDVFIEAFSSGINNIDTAEMYDDGEAERFVGRVVSAVGRDRVFITTKLLPHRFRDRDTAVKAARLSIKRLNINYVDLLLIHWPDPSTPIERQVKSLEAIVEEGLTRYIGVSNFTVKELERAVWALKKYEIVANQVHYSVLSKGIEQDLLPYAIKTGITIQAYTPLEKGRVTQVRAIRTLAEKYGKPPAAVALNYVISRPNVVAIVKTESREHLMEILSALGWRLREQDIEELEKI